MNDYSREIWNGFVPGYRGTPTKPSRQDEMCHVDDGMADTASSNVPTNEKLHSYKRTLQGDSVLQALCQEINTSAEESRRRQAVAGNRDSNLKPKIVHDVIPSGKRKQGEGCEDDQQGILEAFWNKDGRAVLRITLLAAGFVIGPKGQSIRDISDVSGAKIRSWSDNFHQHGKMRRVRQLVVEGRITAIVHALTIIKNAVERYRELYEGGYCNQFVDPIQVIMGVEFTYSPPPRKAVPYAAGIKTKANKSTRHHEEDKKVYRVYNGVMHDGFTAVSSESDQSYNSIWPRDTVRQEPRLSLQSDDMLGLFETPCETYNPKSEEYRRQSAHTTMGHGNISHGQYPQSTSAGYTMFGNQPKGHLQNYPWYEKDMFEKSNVRSLNSLFTDETPAPPRTRFTDTSHQLPSHGHRMYSQVPLWNLEPSPRSQKAHENHLYENMFAEFGHKCHVSDKTPQHMGCDLLSRPTPKPNRQTPNHRVTREESPVHFTFELTLDSSKSQEAKRKLVFEE